VENRKYFPPRVFNASSDGFPLELSIGARAQKTRMMGLQGRQSLTIYSAVCIQCTNVADRQTDTKRHPRPRLRIASHGKNEGQRGGQ